MTRTRADKSYADTQAAIDRSLRADPAIAELIALARQVRARSPGSEPPAEFAAAILRAAALLSATDAGEILGLTGCVDLALSYATVDFPIDAAGQPQRVEGELRARSLPGLDGRAVWVLRNPADVDALGRALDQGQVWIRADLVPASQWGTVNAIAADQTRRLGKLRRPGRPKGSRKEGRADLVKRVQADPSISAEEIDRIGTELGLWESSLDDYVLVGDRARRIRRDAGF